MYSHISVMRLDRSKIEVTARFIGEKFRGEKYAIRGTASLILQNIEMNADDVDILCNADSALKANILLSDYMEEKVEFKENNSFRSYFGKFLINDVNVEIMGDWQIFNKKNGWSKKYFPCNDYTTTVRLGSTDIIVTTSEIELEMFACMGRWTAYQKIMKCYH